MNVAILGCGYVGLELGRQLESHGHDAVGVRRSAEGVRRIEDAGLEAVRADITDPDALADVPDADAIVFIASSGGRGAETAREIYVDGLRTVVEAFGERETHLIGWSTPPRRASTATTTATGSTNRRRSSRRRRKPRCSPRPNGSPSSIRSSTGTTAQSHAMRAVRTGRYRLERYLEGRSPKAT